MDDRDSPASSDPIAEAVGRGDLDELTRLVDGLCAAREWDEVIRLRDRCRHALERGLQLWPAAEYAEYRVALEAPAEWAGSVIREGAGRFALGPLWEVAASTHSWSDLGPAVDVGPARTMAAHERVIRGEDLSGDPSVDDSILEIPLRLEPWEPSYSVATYRAREADFPSPPMPALDPVGLPTAGEAVAAGEVGEALLALGRAWSEQSNGGCRVAAVRGGVGEAIAALDAGAVSPVTVDPATAFAHMAWAAASGGAYGRRAGTPAGRFAAWWVVAAIADLDWPAAGERVGSEAAALTWALWENPDRPTGWHLGLSVADEEGGRGWAVEAWDGHREDDAPAE